MSDAERDALPALPEGAGGTGGGAGDPGAVGRDGARRERSRTRSRSPRRRADLSDDSSAPKVRMRLTLIPLFRQMGWELAGRRGAAATVTLSCSADWP